MIVRLRNFNPSNPCLGEMCMGFKARKWCVALRPAPKAADMPRPGGSCRRRQTRRQHSPWAFGQTEPIGSVPRSFGQFGHQKPETDRSLQKTKTEEVRSRLVRFGLGHDRTNRT